MRLRTLCCTLIFIFICSGGAFSQVLGARLVTLIDLGATVPFEQFGRSVVLVGENHIGVSKDYEIGYKRISGSVVIIDYKNYRVAGSFSFGANDYYSIGNANGNEMLLVIYYKRKSFYEKESVTAYYRIPIDGEPIACTEEYIKNNKILFDDMSDISRWPKDIPIPEPLDWKLRYDGTDWTIFQGKAIILNEFDVGVHDGSMQTIGVYDMNGAFLFRFPYIIMPGGGEYGNPAMMNAVQMSKDKKRLMINGHARLHDIYPELKGIEPNARHEFVWIYELLSDEEWDPKLREEATIVRLVPDLSGIEWTRKVASDRFNVIPGTNPLYGTRATLKYDRVNLRKEPNIKSPIIVTMDMAVHFAHDPRIGFMILERSEHKDTINGEEDYWYRLFFRLHEYEEYEGWVFGSTIIMHDTKIPYDLE